MIIVSLTTIPERLKKDLPTRCIESILKQTRLPDLIVVNIPSISRKKKEYPVELVKKLELVSPLVKIQYGIKDLGPVTKIYPTLDLIKNQGIEDAKIILVDDDCIYDPKMIEILLKVRELHPTEYAIGFAGRSKTRWDKLEFVGFDVGSNGVNDIMYVDLLETFASAMYDYCLFKGFDFYNWLITLPEFTLNSDDIILAEWVKQRGLKLCKYARAYPKVSCQFPSGTPELYITNIEGQNNEKTYEYFEEQRKIAFWKKFKEPGIFLKA